MMSFSNLTPNFKPWQKRRSKYPLHRKTSGGDGVSTNFVQPADCGGLLVARQRGDGHVDVRICYPREFLRSCADSPFAVLPPVNIRQIVFEMSEILAPFPRRYHSPSSIFNVPKPPVFPASPVHSTHESMPPLTPVVTTEVKEADEGDGKKGEELEPKDQQMEM